MDRLYWETYTTDPEGFAHFIDESVGFMHIYLGDVREAVAHSDEISKFGRVIYNESAWDLDKFKEIKEDITAPTHYDTIKECILRIEKYKCKKVDLGYVGRWKNPYQIADTHMPTGITITYEDKDDHIFVRGCLFKPDNWFNLQCKALFKTDPIVEKDAKGSWNMNTHGLIAPKPEKTAGNRRSVFSLVTDFIKSFKPMFSGLALSEIFYNVQSNTAYIVEPEAKENSEYLPLIYYFRRDGKMCYSDSTEIPLKPYGATQVKGQNVYYDKKHFDFF